VIGAKMLNTFVVILLLEVKDFCSVKKNCRQVFYGEYLETIVHPQPSLSMTSDLSPASGIAYDILILSSMFADYQRYLLIMNVYKPNALQNLF
jgi:hypothetical protein